MKYQNLSLALAAALCAATPAMSQTVAYQSVADMGTGNVNAIYCSECFYENSHVTDTFTLGSATNVTGLNLWIYASGGYDAVTSQGFNFTVSDTSGNLLFSQKVYPLTILAQRQGRWSTEDFVGGDISGLNLAAGTYVASFFTDYSLTGDQMAVLGFTGGNGSYTAANDGAGGTTTGNAGYQLLTRAQAPTAVPEPASWALMLGGFGLVGAAMRRRNTVVSFG